MSGLSLAAQPAAAAHEPGRPGLRNASVQFEATEAGGSARIAISGGAVELPGIFAEPLLPLDDFAAQLQWKIDAPTAAEAASKITVQVRDARFANADAKGQLTATWSTGDAGARAFPAGSSSTARSAGPARCASRATCRSTCRPRCATTSSTRCAAACSAT